MFEYLALAHDPDNAQARREAMALTARLPQPNRWRSAFQSDALHVLYRAAYPAFAATVRNDIVIVGNHFPMPASDGSAPPRRTCHPDGFPPDRWGNYVALRVTPDRRLHIYREPTAQLPCLHVEYGGVHVLASRITTLKTVTSRFFPVERAYLHRHLLGRLGTCRCQPLAGLTSVAGGGGGEIDLTQAPCTFFRRSHWQPASWISPDTEIADPNAAAQSLRQVTRYCIEHWARTSPTSLMRLSGGLDSSIVFGCLAQAGPAALTAYTYFDPDGVNDERRWAREAAAHHRFDCRMIAFRTDDVNVPAIATLQPTLEPVSTLPYLQRAPIERSLAAEYGASAVFTGQGGDASFCRDSIALTPLDHVGRHGFTPALGRLCAQVARHTGSSFWQELAAARRYRRNGVSHDIVPGTTELSALLDPEVARARLPAAPTHSWLDTPHGVPSLPRRLGSLLSSVDNDDISAHSDDAPTIISPLLSRPIIETCLRIPSYVHFKDGIERGLARAAFADELPLSIRRRCWKDRAPGFIERIIGRHQSFVREFLLEGILVRDHWLSKPAVEAALADRAGGSQVSALEIMNHVDTEAWVRHWS